MGKPTTTRRVQQRQFSSFENAGSTCAQREKLTRTTVKCQLARVQDTENGHGNKGEMRRWVFGEARAFQEALHRAARDGGSTARDVSLGWPMRGGFGAWGERPFELLGCGIVRDYSACLAYEEPRTCPQPKSSSYEGFVKCGNSRLSLRRAATSRGGRKVRTKSSCSRSRWHGLQTHRGIGHTGTPCCSTRTCFTTCQSSSSSFSP